MLIITNINELRAWRRKIAYNSNISFVPTMGALHAGHMSLVTEAKKRAQYVVASIFVNPLQFGANEDLSRYPRPFEHDVAMLEAHGVGVLFAPSFEELYATGFATQISITSGIDNVLCGKYRAGHFAGVCTVVALLFSLIRPDIALFGEKDFQQLAIINRMNDDLHLVDEIIGVPTMRESDGLAMSSRNQYLSATQRQIAPTLYAVMEYVKERMSANNDINYDANDNQLYELLELGKAKILASGFDKVDYLEVRCAEKLMLVDEIIYANNKMFNNRIFVAAHLGNTRLIDNICV